MERSMQLKLTTDYAIRCVQYLAIKKKYVSTHEISEATGITYDYCHQLLRKLRLSGVVKALAGGRGGYALVKPPEEITMLEIIEAMEKTIRLNPCLEDECYYKNSAKQRHIVFQFYETLQDIFEDYFRGITVKELISQNED